MKRENLFIIGVVYSAILLLLSIANVIDYVFFVRSLTTLIQVILILPTGILMLIGAIGFKYKKSWGRYLLMFAGVLAMPLGLIITYFAYKEKELE